MDRKGRAIIFVMGGSVSGKILIYEHFHVKNLLGQKSSGNVGKDLETQENGTDGVGG